MKELLSDLVGENRNLMIKPAGYRSKMLSSLSRFARPAVRQFSTTVARSFSHPTYLWTFNKWCSIMLIISLSEFTFLGVGLSTLMFNFKARWWWPPCTRRQPTLCHQQQVHLKLKFSQICNLETQVQADGLLHPLLWLWLDHPLLCHAPPAPQEINLLVPLHRRLW